MRIASTTVRLRAVLAAAVLSLAFACPALAASSFSDVPDDAWYGAGKEACVEYVSEKGVMTGYAGTDLFGPEDTFTRAQAITALFRIVEGDPDGLTSDPAVYSAIADESGFSDTEAGAYYTHALNWAAAEGVARGHDGLFRPNEPVAREELVTLLGRAVDFYHPPYMTSPGHWAYEDEDDISEWAFQSFLYALNYGIIKGESRPNLQTGMTEHFLRLKDNATRAEAATMLMRLDIKILAYRPVEQGY